MSIKSLALFQSLKINFEKLWKKILFNGEAIYIRNIKLLVLYSNGFLCYSRTDCSDPLDITLATLETCNDINAACSVIILNNYPCR